MGQVILADALSRVRPKFMATRVCCGNDDLHNGFELNQSSIPAACTDLTLYKLRELAFVLTDSPVNTAVPAA